MTKLLDKIIWVNDEVNKLRQTSPDGKLVYSWKITLFFSLFFPKSLLLTFQNLCSLQGNSFYCWNPKEKAGEQSQKCAIEK